MRRARKKRGWTQETLAVRAGINRVTLGEYENGRLSPQPRRVAQIAKALEMPVRSLIAIDHRAASLADYRGRSGLSQTDAAAQLGISSTKWGALERGAQAPTDEEWARIANITGENEQRLRAAWKRTRRRIHGV
ncbi:DNA-binding XRE family transcriptional regulator [Antricoccus suffuscus]|uniref:DNA-binding XRE family transcriptional regulator n=1 Tax=Antricoccus suffuscus TaxID=1629062 RepID=A0A2T0ZEP6_9ACTN|nr:helix-turn-helix transcriptional regulator [Antricoccus suffuscus]PRZ34807.1 DNA-binding XRE family transcriptional regulator [Antricoccus suffuscus]